MDLWTDFNLNTEWGLDLLDQPNALFGDLKDASRLFGDMDPAHKPRDAVQQPMNSPSSEENIDIGWMESGDLGSFLDALDNSQDKFATLEEDGLFDCSQEIDIKDNVSLTKFVPTFVSSDEVGGFIQGLTPPDSPEQVSPVIKLYPELKSDVITDFSENVFLSPCELDSTQELPLDDQAAHFVLEEQIAPVEVVETQEIYDLSILADAQLEPEVEVISKLGLSPYSSDSGFELSSSPEASPRPSVESMIQSSPELYKVIATTPTISVRFSPYGKSKGEPKIKGESKGVKSGKGKEKELIELFPEELISSSRLTKKERKKIQNKNAAIRYRQKKKIEGKYIVDEVQDLEDKNTDLNTKVEDLQREIKYMKNLMEEIYKAKGIVKS